MLNYTLTTLDDLLINDPASRDRLEGIVKQQPSFPGLGKNGILLHGSIGTGKTLLSKTLPRWLERSGNLPSSKFSNAFMPFTEDQYVSVVHCGQHPSGRSSEFGPGLMLRLERVKNTQGWHASSGWHYEILDEVDQLRSDVLKGLPSAMTASPTTIFIFTTNNPQKLSMQLQNRCHMIEMNQMRDLNAYLPAAKRILAHWNIPLTLPPDAIIQLAAKSHGSIRTFADELSRATMT